jgi:hypothetical protein
VKNFLLLTLVLFHSIELTIGLMIIVNLIALFSISQVQKLYKWRLRTLQKDAFFQNSDFSIGAYGHYSLIAVSKSFIRIVTVKANIRVHRANYDIAEVFPNYPRNGIDINLNGFNVYYLDVPMDTIAKVMAIKNKDAGGFGVLNNLNFGIRLETKENVKIDIDTAFGKEFCEEISPLLTPQIAAE